MTQVAGHMIASTIHLVTQLAQLVIDLARLTMDESHLVLDIIHLTTGSEPQATAMVLRTTEMSHLVTGDSRLAP